MPSEPSLLHYHATKSSQKYTMLNSIYLVHLFLSCVAANYSGLKYAEIKDKIISMKQEDPRLG